MKVYKILTSVFLLTTITFAYLWLDSSRSDEIDSFTADAASSALTDLPFIIEDITISFEAYHSENSSEKERFYEETLLARSLQRLTSNQRLLNAAERSDELEKGWFQEYTNQLFTLRSTITNHSFEDKGTENTVSILSELSQLQQDISYLVEKESFTVTNSDKMKAVTETLRRFNEKFQS